MLCQTYENNSGLAGKSDNDSKSASLSLIAHMTANAQLEITVTAQGAFHGATAVAKENGATMIPITEKSASRSSGVAPHPLCDTLSYLAGDYADYVSGEKEKKRAEAKYTAYAEALQHWAESPYTHPKVKAIYAYLAKRQVIADLLKSNLVELDADGMLADKKIMGNPYEKALVRFCVIDTDGKTQTWRDSTLFDSFIRYYLSMQNGSKDICYLSGMSETACTIHPKGIIASNYGAKLISSNDATGFTYRGRFRSAEEAYSVSYAATQKAHLALTWLAKMQGVSVGKQEKRTYICWNPRGKPVPPMDEVFGFDDAEEDDELDHPLTEPAYQERLYKAMLGYSKVLDNNDDIVIMGLDAATTGRLSVTYYNELKASDFLQRFQDWSATCRWYYPALSQDKRLYYEIRSPLAKRTAEYAFGTQQGNFIELKDKILKEQYQRILHCMFDAQPVPRDIVHALAIRASNPQAYSFWNYENILSTACAYIVKYYASKGVKLEMTLDYNQRDRSYLFGRLLAICEKIERATYGADENREPNAIRLQSAFVHHPMYTWKALELSLNPYLQRHTPAARQYYRNMISELVELIQDGDEKELNKSLDDLYLIGYYLQRAEQKKGKSHNNKQEEKA